jgi:hypothetical protein
LPNQYSQIQTSKLIIWKQLCPRANFLINSEQAIVWLENYPLEFVDESIRIGAGWYNRELNKGLSHSEGSAIRYVSAVLRNKLEAHERHVKEAAKAAELALIPEVDKNAYPEGFEFFSAEEMQS